MSGRQQWVDLDHWLSDQIHFYTSIEMREHDSRNGVFRRCGTTIDLLTSAARGGA